MAKQAEQQTEQEILSNAYHNLIEIHQKLKEKCIKQGVSNATMNENNTKLWRQINDLKAEVESLKEQINTSIDEVVLKLPKDSNLANFVTLKRYNKLNKLAQEYAIKYGESERSNSLLREMLRNYETKDFNCWKALWTEIEIFYGDIKKEETEEQFLERMAKIFKLALADRSKLKTVASLAGQYNGI